MKYMIAKLENSSLKEYDPFPPKTIILYSLSCTTRAIYTPVINRVSKKYRMMSNFMIRFNALVATRNLIAARISKIVNTTTGITKAAIYPK